MSFIGKIPGKDAVSLNTAQGLEPRNTKIAAESIILGDCIAVMKRMAATSIDFVLTDPPYLVGYQDRSGRSIANDRDDAWLKPAFAQIYRVLQPNSFCVSF